MSRRQQIERFRKTTFGRQLERFYLSFRFRKEMAAYSGQLKSQSGKASILHFSVNKAATQHTKEVLKELVRGTGIIPLDYNDFAFHSKRPFLDHLSAEQMQAYQHLFSPTGFLYSVFGGYVPGIANLDQYRVILMVRDPRDILVSDFYSIRHSHPEPNAKGDKHASFVERRATSLQKTIDQFVLDEAAGYQNRFMAYRELLGKPNVKVLRYEDMLTDYPAWLQAIADHVEIRWDSKVLEKLIQKNANLFTAKEQPHSHYRKGAARDFQEKLKPETIAKFNAIFADTLTIFGYEI